MQKYLAFFGSRYICETIFSLFKITKSENRSRITDDNLEAVLRIATSEFSIDFNRSTAFLVQSLILKFFFKKHFCHKNNNNVYSKFLFLFLL